ncbi:TPA: hypothetical protein ACHJUH_003549, partial [Escherichia coli]
IFSYLGFAFGKILRHFAGIAGFLILHQLLIIARNVAQFHGNCLVALVYRWSLRVSFLPLFVEVKKIFHHFTGARCNCRTGYSCRLE